MYVREHKVFRYSLSDMMLDRDTLSRDTDSFNQLLEQLLWMLFTAGGRADP
jgi:hypothetical protein